jgi:hypothetical protein
MGFPHGQRKTTTLVAGLRNMGMVAPLVIDGPINGEWFGVCRSGSGSDIETRRRYHRRQSVQPQATGSKEMIEAVGATMTFLPPCSPDFNPIEKAFSKLKALL